MGDIDVGHNFRVLMTEFDIGDNFWMLVPDANVKNHGDEHGQSRHQHLKIVANKFRLQYPSPTLMLPLRSNFDLRNIRF